MKKINLFLVAVIVFSSFGLNVYAEGAPSAPVINSISPDTGVSDSDHITNVNTPTFSGVSDVHTSVSLSIYNAGCIASGDPCASPVLESAATMNDGTWSIYVPINIADGDYEARATSTNEFGYTISDLFNFTIDTTPVDGLHAMMTQVSSDLRPIFIFEGGNYDIFQISIDGTPIEIETHKLGTDIAFAFQSKNVLPDGDHDATFSHVDLAGNISVSSEKIKFTISTDQVTNVKIFPLAPTITSPVSGLYVDQNPFIISGTCSTPDVPNSITLGFTNLGNVVASGADCDSNGQYTVSISAEEMGEITTFPITMEAYYNSSEYGGSTNISDIVTLFDVSTEIDNNPVIKEITINGLNYEHHDHYGYSKTINSHEAIIDISFDEYQISSEIVILDSLNNGSVISHKTFSNSKNISYSLNNLSDGSYRAVVVTENNHGGKINFGEQTFVFNVDNVAPNAPVISSPISSPYNGNSSVDISGTCDDSENIVLISAKTAGSYGFPGNPGSSNSVQCSEEGTFALNIPSLEMLNDYEFALDFPIYISTKQLDKAGNYSDISNTVIISAPDPKHSSSGRKGSVVSHGYTGSIKMFENKTGSSIKSTEIRIDDTKETKKVDTVKTKNKTIKKANKQVVVNTPVVIKKENSFRSFFSIIFDRGMNALMFK